MWLSRLDLLAFGKFTDARLDLGQGFHLVYGPNEAGKSTALRAIRQLLFGFDARTPDNFLHANPNLRVGGVVCAGASTELAVIRRKSRKDSLLADDEKTAIDPRLWQDLLSGVDETTFCQRYGIDYEQLIQGGHQIASGDGDLGEILFATGSGVMDLNAIQRGLTLEADELFKPQGKKQRINQAIGRWQELKDQVRDKLLSVSAWEEADRSRKETLSHLDQASNELTKLTNQFQYYKRLNQSWPLVRDMDSVLGELGELAAIRRVGAEFGTKRQEALRLFKQSESDEATAAQIIQSAERELSSLRMPPEFVSHASELSTLITQWTASQKTMHDRVKLAEQCQRHQSMIETSTKIFEQSGIVLPQPFPPVDREIRARISSLSRKNAVLTQSLKELDSARIRLSHELDQAKSKLLTIAEARPVDELRDRLREFQNDGDLEARLLEVQSELSLLRTASNQQIHELGLGGRSIEDVMRIQVPDRTILGELASSLQSRKTERSLLRSRLDDLEVDHRKLSQKIDHLRGECQVPTQADLERVRTFRSQTWSQIRHELDLKRNPDQALIQNFETSMQEVDSISDRLRQEADRVAQLMDDLENQKSNEAAQHEISIRLAQLDSDRIELEKRWQSEWGSLASSAPSPDELQTWLTRRESFIASADLSRRRELEVRTLTDRIHRNRGELSRLLGREPVHPPTVEPQGTGTAGKRRTVAARKQLSFGWEPDTQSASAGTGLSDPATATLKELLLQADQQLAKNEASQQARRETLDSVNRLSRQLSETAERASATEYQLSEWNSDWQDAMSKIGLPSDLSPETAETVVEALSDLANHQEQATQLKERISEIDADIGQIETLIHAFCQKAAPDLAETNAEKCIEELREQLKIGQREERIRNEQSVRKTKAEFQRNLAREARTKCEVLVAELRQDAGLETTQDHGTVGEEVFAAFELVEKRDSQRRLLEQRLERIRHQLTELANGESVDALAELARSQYQDLLNQKIAELEMLIQKGSKSRDQLNQRLGGIQIQLGQMNGGSDAAEAEELRQQCLAQIQADAEEYIRLKLASSVLHASIERYREKIRDPVLKIAGELFCELTLGSFAGLRVDEDDSHKPILVGIRSNDGRAVGVSGMSEGTCDQLYLALRLASLQLETAPRKDLPLIIDDILIQFDDARVVAALRILARLSLQRQVIFFTHHEHVVQLAHTHIPGDFVSHRLEI